MCRLRTLSEVLGLALGSGQRGGRAVGVYIETKDPAFHRSVGLPLEGKLVDALVQAGYREQPSAPVILQSFEEQVHNPVAQMSCQPKFQVVVWDSFYVSVAVVEVHFQCYSQQLMAMPCCSQ